MTDDALWEAKLAQLFHDPFLKAWCQGVTAKAIARDLAQAAQDAGPEEEVPEILWDKFAQEKVGALLSRRLLGDRLVMPLTRYKWGHGQEMAKELGAGLLPAYLAPDFAASGADRPVLGTADQVRVQFWEAGRENAQVTHPLDDAVLALKVPSTEKDLLARLRPAAARLDRYRGHLNQDRFRRAWYLMWRRLPEELAGEDGVFWPLQPADTRCPDHSIWDHLRMASALAFMPQSRTADERLRAGNPAKRPWLLSLWVGPARDYLGQARSGRDLWTGSMLLSELAWAMIVPLVEAFGPDAVLYPDLRANRRADLWIDEKLGRDILGDKPEGTRAALIPNRLVALVPEGARGEIAEKCLEAARRRWREMAQAVRDDLFDKVGGGAWEAIFDRQVAPPPALRWSAVPWVWDGEKGAKIKRQDIHLDPAIPCQNDPDHLPKPIREIEDKRSGRFAGWIDPGTWNHYQALRQTALMTHPGYLLGQRGFDYPLAHHQLLVLDSARSRLGQPAAPEEEGEKCTLCGCRQALTNGGSGPVGAQREAARRFWAQDGLDPDGEGAERLCGPCAVRRFLSDSDNRLRTVWEGTFAPQEIRAGRHAVPFPSTGLIAGQEWLAGLCEAYKNGDSKVVQAVRGVVQAFGAVADLPRTQFANSLPRLRRCLAGADATLRRFLEYDIQLLDPDWWDARRPDPAARQACGQLAAAKGRPETALALIALDGDRMGRLLQGDPERVQARWQDVLHPDAVAQIREGETDGDGQKWKLFWRTTLDRPRALGPSTHAFISRALRHFANRILPWVVEREFGGKLIYAGGDDALILCPAADAVALLCRLDALFTAPWVHDTIPDARPWPGEEPGEMWYEVGSDAARSRFAVLKKEDIPREGRVIPMLGRHQSFSAGVAFGFYKIPLRQLCAAALENRDRAKAVGGRRAGLSWFTRNGEKLRWIAPLARDGIGGLKALTTLASYFGSGILPRRLPYKLRAMLPAARAIIAASTDRREPLLERLVRHALDGAEASNGLVAGIWQAGLEAYPDAPERSLDGLLLARALSKPGPNTNPESCDGVD